jgi:hypothetical protein
VKNFLLSAAAAAVLTLLAGCHDDGGNSADTSGSSGASSSTGSTSAPTASQVRHVFVIMLENEDYTNSFASTSAAPYLAQTLPMQGALLQNYYGTGHQSLDNYISMISGQGPNTQTQLDCQTYENFTGTAPTAALDNQAIGSGCIFPTTVPSLPDQLTSANLSWKAYMEDMGNTPTRESATCGHPTVGSSDGTQTATAADNYATRHDPFMYFHSIIDNQAVCNAQVVNLDDLDADLGAVSSTANYVFITPSLCHDGHDSPCADGEPGGLTSINGFLQEWVPKILASPAFQQDGLLIITFDESNGFETDSSACCGESASPNAVLPGLSGLGGGKVGAVLLSPFIKPGTVSTVDYNHYSTLRSVEDLFGLPYLGYAGLSGQSSFGSDIFTLKQPVLPAKN